MYQSILVRKAVRKPAWAGPSSQLALAVPQDSPGRGRGRGGDGAQAAGAANSATRCQTDAATGRQIHRANQAAKK